MIAKLIDFFNFQQMHKTELVRALETAIEDAEKCASVIQQLDLNKMRTRTRHHDPKYRLTIHELTLFAAEIDGLACVLPEGMETDAFLYLKWTFCICILMLVLVLVLKV